MPHIVTEPCLGCKHADCIDVCPVDCFHQDERMLLIDPFECIDCGACIPVCPEEAIFIEEKIPPQWAHYIEINAEKAPGLPLVSTSREVDRIDPESHCSKLPGPAPALPAPPHTSIYLDHHATTPVDPRVLEAMLPWFSERYGNAASFHAAGQSAHAAVDQARAQVATLINADPRGILFTSGATEANHLALAGLAAFHHPRPVHLVTCVTEHPAILENCEALEAAGAAVTRLPVDACGRVDPAAVRDAITPDTLVVSLMAANNEIGTQHDLAAIGAITREANTFFHCDASQALGILPLDVEAMHIDLLSATAHKLYGPKGSGFLWIRRKRPRVRLLPRMHGGGHQQGLRPGTLNVPGIVGLGLACELAGQEMTTRQAHLLLLRCELEDQLRQQFPDLVVNGHPDQRHPGNLNVTLPGIPSRHIRAHLPHLAISSGSACASALQEPSHVLRAIGLTTEAAHQTLRFGVGKDNTRDDIHQAVSAIAAQARRP